MRRVASIVLLCLALIGAALSLSGCIVVPARPYHHRVWVPGYWAPTHVWVGGYWGYR